MSNQSVAKSTASKTMSMAELLASYDSKRLAFKRGDKVSGSVMSIFNNDIILDLGTKSEAVVNRRDLSSEQLLSLKIGDTLEGYVMVPESDNGQVIVTLHRQLSTITNKKTNDNLKKWQKFITAMQQKTKLMARVGEVNKGGFVVEVDGVRGFLPSSQIGFDSMGKVAKSSSNISGLVGQDIPLYVIEVDPSDNRLVFSGRGLVSDETKAKLAKYEVGQKVTGNVVAVVSFGVFLDIDGLEGLVFSQEASWERVEDLTTMFEVGQGVEALVINKDDSLGRLNLSVKRLNDDPMSKLLDQFQADDVIKSKVASISGLGITFELKDKVEGFLPAAKLENGVTYEVGQEVSLVIDGIEKSKRRVILAPFITSTIGLIYK